VDTVKWPGARRRARRHLTLVDAREALVSLPNVHWRDPESEEEAYAELQKVAEIIDRALRHVPVSSEQARALKYAQARLTAFLEGWNDPGLIAPIHLDPMYQSLKAALQTLSRRLETGDNADPPAEPADPIPPP
jgi:hypothetical protein